MAKKLKVKRGNAVMGEFTEEEFIEKLKNGLVSCYDLIYYPKNDKWIEINLIRDIGEYAGDKFHWKFKKDNDDHGPISKDDLIFFIKEGKVTNTEMVYHPSLKKWKKLEEVDEFKQLAKGVDKKIEIDQDLGDILKVIEYKVCPKCEMQSLKSTDICSGCGYTFPEESEE